MSNRLVSRLLLVRILLHVFVSLGFYHEYLTLSYVIYYTVLEWYKDHKYVPELLEDIMQVYDVLKQKVPAKPTDSISEEVKAAYDDCVCDMDLLVWYLDKYLPAAVGEPTFGKSQRYYNEIQGKICVLVERQSEAYGWSRRTSLFPSPGSANIPGRLPKRKKKILWIRMTRVKLPSVSTVKTRLVTWKMNMRSNPL
jgi:hypothetical protein